MGLLRRLFEPEHKPVSAKVVRNTLFSALQNVLVFPIPFFIIPFILKRVGVYDYGIYAIFVTVIGFTSLTDVGMFGTLTKHVAEYYARGDFTALKRLVDTGLMFYIIISLVTTASLWFSAGHLLPSLFRNISVNPRELRVLWLIMILTMGVNILTAPFSSVILGLQRMDLSSALGFVSVVSNAILTVALLELGWQLRGLLYASLAAALLSLVLLAGSAYRLLPEISINPFCFDPRELTEIFNFSWRLYTTQITGTVQSQIEKIYLAWFVGVTPVGWYNIANSAGQKARRLPDLLLGPLMAAAAELDAKGHADELRELYYRAHKYMAFFSLPIIALTALLCRPFVTLWLGPRLNIIAIPLALLVLTNIVIVTTGPGVLISVGQGKLAPAVDSALFATFLNLLISFFLIRYYGFSGAVTGTLVSASAGTIAFIYLFHRSSGYAYKRLFTESYLKPLGASMAGVGAVYPIVLRISTTWGGLALDVMVFGAIYISVILIARFFDAFDFQQARKFLPMFRSEIEISSLE